MSASEGYPRAGLRAALPSSRGQAAIGVAAALVGLVLVLVVGTGGSRAGAVVAVAGTPISHATYEHWLTAAARTQASQNPTTSPLPPDPPAFTRCVADAQRRPALASGQGTPAVATLRSQCAQRYTTLRNAALQLLISSQWILSEAAREHLAVSSSSVESAVAKYRRQYFPKAGGLEQYLSKSGMTLADLRYQLRVSMFATSLEVKHAQASRSPTAAEVQSYYQLHRSSLPRQSLAQASPGITRTLTQQLQAAAFASYTTTFTSYWKSRTVCEPTLQLSAYCRTAS